jgi:hypothetical protein
LTGTFLVACERGPSVIAGRGWFAAEPLAPGVAVWRGDPAECPLNHSCDPSVWWSGDVLVTRRAVAVGEELTGDYSTANAHPSFLLVCHCESYRCRQMVTGDDWRIPELQRRYAGHFADGMREVLDGQDL